MSVAAKAELMPRTNASCDLVLFQFTRSPSQVRAKRRESCQILASQERDLPVSRKLDAIDVKLLACLQEDALQTADALAERVGLSPSAVARRLRQLRASNAIAGEIAVVSDESAGQPLFAIVQITLERHAPQAADSLRRRLVQSPNVQMCLDVAGTFDIVLLVAARDMEAYNALADSLLEADPAVRRFVTSFVKKRTKMTLALPLEQLIPDR